MMAGSKIPEKRLIFLSPRTLMSYNEGSHSEDGKGGGGGCVQCYRANYLALESSQPGAEWALITENNLMNVDNPSNHDVSKY